MARLTVLGIGNILMRDEGIGVRLSEAVMVAHDWPAEIEFIDGGAGGLNLLNFIEQAEAMVVFDAADMNLSAGEHRIIEPSQIVDDTPTHRISLHDEPFIETLKLCEQFTRRPEFVKIFAVQPKAIDFGREFSDEMQAAFDGLLASGIDLVKDCAKQVEINI